jgi:hypothetical protein
MPNPLAVHWAESYVVDQSENVIGKAAHGNAVGVQNGNRIFKLIQYRIIEYIPRLERISPSTTQARGQ